MQTEVKNTEMAAQIAELADEVGLKPGQVWGVLNDLGVAHDQNSFEADEDTVQLIKESLREIKGSKEIVLKPARTPRDVAAALGVPQQEVVKSLMTKLRTMATLTTTLKPEIVEQLISLYGYTVRWSDAAKPKPVVAPQPPKAPVSGAGPRPPVVTIMGHVDHGKTSLLDHIRKANVAGKEHGGITQHIGAYQVELPEGKITFLDTPGHAAFTSMRARGAQVTDVAILVVAADDGIMPQTIEAINHAKSAGVPIIVAVNKIDRPDATPERVLTQLTEHELIPEAFGGQTITANVSALTGEGVPHLLEMILLQAEVLDLKADPKGQFDGVVIEAKKAAGKGPVATVLVKEGTLKQRDSIVVGNTFGRIRSMTDYKGAAIEEAGPATPVEVMGLNEVPQAGDKVEVYPDEPAARAVAESRVDAERQIAFVTPVRGMSLSQLRAKLTEEEAKDLNLVVKADAHGSVEAIKGMLEKIENAEVNVKVIHSGVGSITESDILLASAAEAICVGFNTKPEPGAKTEAERRKVEIRTYKIIYELIEDIEAAATGMLEPKFEESYLGTVEIRVVFKLSRKGIIAGSHITDGKVVRGAQCRVKRGTDLVYEGKVATLKHVKEDVRELAAGFDCGLTFEGWEAFKEGDLVEVFEMIQV